MAEQSTQDLAEERTNWAEDRTILANERTFAAWIRTGLGSVGIGIGLNAVFSAAEPTWLAKLAAMVFLLIGLFVFQLAHVQACKLLKRMASHASAPASQKFLWWVAQALTVATIMVAGILWII